MKSFIPATVVLMMASILFAQSNEDSLGPGTTKVNRRDGFKYVWIPSATFAMGCSFQEACPESQKPRHLVTITRSYWVGQTPVTQEAWGRIMARRSSYYHGARLPVENVSWFEAKSYCEKVGLRLPTEAEWEYAARAGSSKAVGFGEESLASEDKMLEPFARYHDNSQMRTHEVGRKRPNNWGLYDTLGNVWQWVDDWYAPYKAEKQIDPKGPPSGELRVLRGGSWMSEASFVSASVRGVGQPESSSSAIGFRCAGELP